MLAFSVVLSISAILTTPCTVLLGKKIPGLCRGCLLNFVSTARLTFPLSTSCSGGGRIRQFTDAAEIRAVGSERVAFVSRDVYGHTSCSASHVHTLVDKDDIEEDGNQLQKPKCKYAVCLKGAQGLCQTLTAISFDQNGSRTVTMWRQQRLRQSGSFTTRNMPLRIDMTTLLSCSFVEVVVCSKFFSLVVSY